MADFEAVGWKLTGKGDRIVGFCGHTHRTFDGAKACAHKLNAKSEDLNPIWVASHVPYVQYGLVRE